MPIRALILLIPALFLAAGEAPSTAFPLVAPLVTVVPVPRAGSGPCAIRAVVTVPPGAPADLGVGAFVGGRHGGWHQRMRPGVLPPGRHELRFDFAAGAPAEPGDEPVAWGAPAAALASRAGLLLWSAAASRIVVEVAARIEEPSPAAAAAPSLVVRSATSRGRTGERWSCLVDADPLPTNPDDPEQFALDGEITAPDGRVWRIPGFWEQPMSGEDAGDRERVEPSGPGRFQLRWRPQQPGTHRVRLTGRWAGGRTRTVDLPPVEVAGAAWDGYARVDGKDPRFFAVDGRFWWPVGINLRSVNDSRCAGALGSKMTPARGSLAYGAFLDRFSAAGCDAAEIWLSSWNLALEWRGDWAGFHGAGRYNPANAWRVDRILDRAWERGMRVNLVLRNHGMGSEKVDHEWENSPFNQVNGGWLAKAAELATDARALAMQDRFHRYVIARWGDHPAVMGWKLWSEINLTAAFNQAPWHDRASRWFAANDPYGHPCTTHWAGDWRSPNPEVCAVPGIRYLCIDAYHSRQFLPQLLAESIGGEGAGRGLGWHGKPVVVTEFGANFDAGPTWLVPFDHATGPWAALVAGLGGSPWLWWWEWVDQRGGFAPYRAIRAFVAGEDLRGADARSMPLDAGGAPLWVRAWVRPQRLLGYAVDRDWQRVIERGEQPPERGAAVIRLGAVAAGRMRVQWWDADAGAVTAEAAIDHPGGALEVHPPAFRRHLAFKVWRE